MKNLPLRRDVPQEQTWDLASLFPDQEAWEKAYREVEEGLVSIKQFQGSLAKGPEQVTAWLNTSQALIQKFLFVSDYASLCFAVDTTNAESAGMFSRVSGLTAQVEAAVAFAIPELLETGSEKLKQWAAENPSLSQYTHYFEILQKRSGHVRSSEVEEILGQMQDPFLTASETHGILANSELTFMPARATGSEKPVEVTHSKMRHLLNSEDRKLRKRAWRSYADAHLAYKNTMANCLVAGYKQDVLRSRIRRYDTALEAALSENDIPVAVYPNVVETFKANLPIWHRYWELRRKVYKLRKLHVYDTYAPIGEEPMDVPYEQAVEWIVEGLKPMGPEYTDILRRGATQDRWVDHAMNVGKRFGAFSSGVKDSHPYIMMSYDRSIYSVSTLAHELGHSMHTYYAGNAQPLIYAQYGLFVAETASNFHQAMVRNFLLKNFPKRKFQLAVLLEAMSNFYRYFFTMPVLAMFDQEVHQRVERGEALNAEILNGIMADLLQAGYGPNVVVDRERDGCLWAQFSTHLYSNFYTYQYTTGISAAHALAPDVLSGSASARDHYQAFLKSGASLFPIDALKLAGVDMTRPEPIQQTFQVLAGYIDRLEGLLG